MRNRTAVHTATLILLAATGTAGAAEKPADPAAPIDEKTLDAWSAPYRGWHYRVDPVIPSDYKVPGHEAFHNFDVPTVYQIPGQPGKWLMSCIGLITSKP